MTNLSSLSKAQFCVIMGGISFGAAIWASGSVPFLIAFLAVALIFLLGGLFFIERAQNAIKDATAICKRLEAGDFEARLINIPQDGEISEFLWSVNEMTDRMDAFVREATAAMEYVSHNQYFRRILEDGLDGALLGGARIINTATQSVAKKMGDFADVANDVDDSLKSVMGQINETVFSLENNTNTMESAVTQARGETEKAASNSNETSLSAQSISAAAEQMSASIAEISTQITRTATIATGAVESADEARQTVNTLAETAETISQVIATIEDIANQTNLLALNATIEAARAGEAGKGFAVVASEVKDLAAETAIATEDIRNQIMQVQSATGEAVSAFDGIGKTINEISEACSVVAAAVEEQNAASKEIASNAERASNATQSMAQNIKDISGNVTQVDDISQQVKSTAKTLSEQSKQQVGTLLEKMNTFMSELKKIA